MAFMGNQPDFVAAYMQQQAEGLRNQAQASGAAAQVGGHFCMPGMPVAAGQACAAAAPNGLYTVPSHRTATQPGLKQEQLQDIYAYHSTSSKESVTTAAAHQANGGGVGLFAPTQNGAQPKYTSAFSLPSGMVPNPVTAPMSSDLAPVGMMGLDFSRPNQQQAWFDSYAGAQAQAQAQAQAAQQQMLAMQQQQQIQQHQHQQLQHQHQHHQQLLQQHQQQQQQLQQQQQQQQQQLQQQQHQQLQQQHQQLLQQHQQPSYNAGLAPVPSAVPAASAHALSFTARAHSQTLSSSSAVAAAAAAVQGPAGTAGSALPPDDEPDLSHLTVMQRYHARRKLAVQRMEREVEEKIAQLAVLEQENRKLKWQAHILENMLLDIDKQLEVMSTSESAPDASQWLTLLGMGQPSANSARVARTVHKMLEGAGQVDLSGWTVQDCRRRWLAYLEQLQPLVQQAEAAQEQYRASQPAVSQDISSANGSGSGRRPRRAAAAAAAAVIQQEAADVVGVVVPIPPSAIPEPPAPVMPRSPSSPSASGQQQQSMAASDAAQQQSGPQRANSGCSEGEHSHANSDSSAPPAHALSVEGVPPALLQQIEELVLHTFYWLLAMMTSNPVLTYEFISMDLVDGTRPLPPQEDRMWADAIARVQPTLDQLQECSTCIQVSRRCMAKVIEERAEIQESMHCSVESEMHTHLSEDVLQLNCRDAAVDRMRANVRKESVVRNMVGFYCINVFSLYQLAKVSVACAPWFCMAWRVVGAMDERLEQQLAEAGRQGGRGNGSCSGHNTRSSARLAAQR